ncbi:hypothetical protein B0H12DRAFT_139194 [Mycena haematopus]|nr:hypothetical protein B0H12DRAFT_139194 [Mycena haematopus]
MLRGRNISLLVTACAGPPAICQGICRDSLIKPLSPTRIQRESAHFVNNVIYAFNASAQLQHSEYFTAPTLCKPLAFVSGHQPLLLCGQLEVVRCLRVVFHIDLHSDDEERHVEAVVAHLSLGNSLDVESVTMGSMRSEITQKA